MCIDVHTNFDSVWTDRVRRTRVTELLYATILHVSLVLLIKLFSANSFLVEFKSFFFLFLFIKIMQNWLMYSLFTQTKWMISQKFSSYVFFANCLHWLLSECDKPHKSNYIFIFFNRMTESFKNYRIINGKQWKKTKYS